MVMDGIIKASVFGQIGDGLYLPRQFSYQRFLTNTGFREQVSKSSAIISHAGIGIISLALEYRKPLLVLPRLQRLGEHVNDHQVATAKKFEELGHLILSSSTYELRSKIPQLKGFVPNSRVVDVQRLARRIGQVLSEW